MHGDLEVSGMYSNVNFWSFKSTNTFGLSGTALGFGDELTNNALGAVVSSGFKDMTRCVGGAGINIYFEGFPAGAIGL